LYIFGKDKNLIDIPARTVDEPLYLIVGKIMNKLYSAVITYRNAFIRIIYV